MTAKSGSFPIIRPFLIDLTINDFADAIRDKRLERVHIRSTYVQLADKTRTRARFMRQPHVLCLSRKREKAYFAATPEWKN